MDLLLGLSFFSNWGESWPTCFSAIKWCTNQNNLKDYESKKKYIYIYHNISAGWTGCLFDLKDPEYWIPVHNCTTRRTRKNKNRCSLSQFLSHCKILLAAVANKWNSMQFLVSLGTILSLGRNIWNGNYGVSRKSNSLQEPHVHKFPEVSSSEVLRQTNHSGSLLTTLGADSRQDLRMILFLQWHDLG